MKPTPCPGPTVQMSMSLVYPAPLTVISHCLMEAPGRFRNPEETHNAEPPQRRMATCSATGLARCASNDREFVVENSMPSGRYPKLWDQPAMQRLQKKTGALFVPTHLCEWGLAPSDEPDKRYKKGQWNLVSPGLYAYALLLARRCRGQHEHVQLKGAAPSSSYPRTREAQVYPKRLCRAWAVVVQAAYFGWGPRTLLPKLQRILGGDGQKGGALKKDSSRGPEGSLDTSGLQAITENRTRNRHCGAAADEEEAEERGPPEEAQERGPPEEAREAEAAGAGTEAGEDAEADGEMRTEGTEESEEAVGGFRSYRVERCQWTAERLQAYFDDRVQSYNGERVEAGDYWDFNGDNGLLRRHHGGIEIWLLMFLRRPSKVNGAALGKVSETPPRAVAFLWALGARKAPAVIDAGDMSIRFNDDRASGFLDFGPAEWACCPSWVVIGAVAKE